jgi:hypothetical protein
VVLLLDADVSQVGSAVGEVEEVKLLAGPPQIYLL